MNLKYFLFILSILLLVSSVAADTNSTIYFKDKYQNPIFEGSVFIVLNFNDDTYSSFETLISDGYVDLSLGEGVDYVEFTLLTKNESVALYGLTSNFESEISVLMYEFSTIKGVVLDEKQNLIPNVEIQCSCNLFLDSHCPTNADEFGSFEIYAVKEGNCKLFGKKFDQIGFVSLNIQEGEVYDTEIILNESNSFNYWIIFLIVIILAVLVFIVYLLLKTSKKDLTLKVSQNESKYKSEEVVEVLNKEIVKKDETISLDSRMNDLLALLDDNEESVVKFLIENKGKSSQSKIRYGISIPKTTLFRVLKRLELKNLVRTETVGKMKKVFLTDFFLFGKEKISK